MIIKIVSNAGLRSNSEVCIAPRLVSTVSVSVHQREPSHLPHEAFLGPFKFELGTTQTAKGVIRRNPDYLSGFSYVRDSSPL